MLDLLDLLNVVDRLEGLVTRISRTDRKRGAGEFIRSITGANEWSFSIPRDAGWTGASIEQFLTHYGIKVWGRRVTSQHFHFSVEERQANWAEYLLLRRGIPVESRLFNPQNAGYGAEHAPGDQPPAWADRPAASGKQSFLKRMAGWLD